jgi:hypothetical protein
MKLPALNGPLAWEWKGSDGRELRIWSDGKRLREDTLADGILTHTVIDLGQGHVDILYHGNKGIHRLRTSRPTGTQRPDPDNNFDWTEEGRFVSEGRELISFVYRAPETDAIALRRVIDVTTGCKMRIEDYRQNGTLCFRMEAANLRVGALDDAVFEIPVQFEVRNLEQCA